LVYDFGDTLVSLLTAFVLNTLIGAERQYRQRTAGLAPTCWCGQRRRSLISECMSAVTTVPCA
jgi:hypothetical protein